MAAQQMPSLLAYGIGDEVLTRMPSVETYGDKLDRGFIANYFDSEEEAVSAILSAAGYGTWGAGYGVSQEECLLRTGMSIEEYSAFLFSGTGEAVPYVHEHQHWHLHRAASRIRSPPASG